MRSLLYSVWVERLPGGESTLPHLEFKSHPHGYIHRMKAEGRHVMDYLFFKTQTIQTLRSQNICA
jgi:hypothetical protein